MCGECDWNDDYQTGPPIESNKVRFKLIEQDAKVFFEKMNNPPSPNEKLKEAYERYNRIKYGINWISISETSPEWGKMVLVYRGKTDIQNRWKFDLPPLMAVTDKYDNTITHWMPLPMPPQVVEDKKTLDTPNA